jgi:NADH-quinone oxidoreductase subunit I
MNALFQYISTVFKGVGTLLTGMKVTGKYVFTPWRNVTQQYPENREKLQMFERFRICEISCPNGSIEIISKMEVNEEGKKKRAIDMHIYHLGMCTLCNLCVKACPTGAIVMGQNFEHAVWDRSKLTKVLNQPGSKIAQGVKE